MATEIRRSTDDHGEGRYTILVDGQPAGELDYRTIEGRRAPTHTGVRDRYEGQGLAAQLVRRALDDARAEDQRIVPLCPYVASYLEKHPDDEDLVDRELYERLTS
ncbi:MAG TPA: GNAT family N-acetyltransferase [Aquihabitans sp.]|jgi:hypothetical protein|nr:GNAT family N-acetyltransferase [Aquihabitans sp.]